MNTDEARDIICAALAKIAPEVDPHTIDPAVELGPELDLDSMDFLNLVDEVSSATGDDIPERDYPRIGTLASFAAYLTERGGTRKVHG